MPTNFERVRAMLDNLCPALGDNGGERCAAALVLLSSKYSGLSHAANAPIDYSDPATQAAYVYKYVPAHAELIYKSLRDSGQISRDIFMADKVHVLSIGGGPGTELLGIMKFAERIQQKSTTLEFRIWDYNEPWKATIAAAAATAPANLAITNEFNSFDWRHADEWDAGSCVALTDILTLSFTLSEVWRYNADGSVGANLDRILSALKTGAIVVYSDNAGNDFDPYLQQHLLDRTDLTVIGRTDYNDVGLLGSDEQMSVVADYRSWMGAGYGTICKLKGKATCVVFRKNA